MGLTSFLLGRLCARSEWGGREVVGNVEDDTDKELLKQVGNSIYAVLDEFNGGYFGQAVSARFHAMGAFQVVGVVSAMTFTR